MSKRTKSLITLVICLLLAGAVGLIIIKTTKTEEEETETEATADELVSILELDTSKIVHIDWRFSTFIEESFSKKEGTWIYDTDPDTFFYQEVFTDWLQRNLSAIYVYREVESTDFESMGLTDGDVTAHITMDDGTEYTLTYGNSTAIAGTCYFTMDGKKAYTAPRTGKASFGLKLANYQTTPSTEDED